MIKKMFAILVIVSVLGFSTGYAYDGEDDGHNQSVNVAVIAALTLTTVVLLVAALDRRRPSRNWEI